MPFIPGYASPVGLAIQGGQRILRITGWNASEEVQRLITSYAYQAGAVTNGRQACVAGILDFTANVTGNLLSSDMLWNGSPGALRTGDEGVMYFYVSNTSTASRFALGVLVTKINTQSAVAGLISWNFDVGMNADVTGFDYTRPANYEAFGA